MIEASPSNDLQLIGQLNNQGFSNDLTYIFDYTKPNFVYQFTHGVDRGSPKKWEHQLAGFFKKNINKWADRNFTSESWKPINDLPQTRQTVNIARFFFAFNHDNQIFDF